MIATDINAEALATLRAQTGCTTHRLDVTDAAAVSALAEATGTPVETIRFYEREGLLPPPARLCACRPRLRQASTSGWATMRSTRCSAPGANASSRTRA